MNSKSQRFPNGMDESGTLGGYLMDHHLGAGASASLETHQDKIHYGRRPNGFYIPCFRTFNRQPSIGLGIHEMGTARMGSSVLNSTQSGLGAKNVFCTDGSAMVSAGCKNPSLTYMALTARAADYAVKELKNGNL
ncbi:MAG: GMC oxidoreductase [Akkermansiaceae bacterium]|nr:GMC oxidoreductase [Akkermansiaceae bacterium]